MEPQFNSIKVTNSKTNHWLLLANLSRMIIKRWYASIWNQISTMRSHLSKFPRPIAEWQKVCGVRLQELIVSISQWKLDLKQRINQCHGKLRSNLCSTQSKRVPWNTKEWWFLTNIQNSWENFQLFLLKKNKTKHMRWNVRLRMAKKESRYGSGLLHRAIKKA